VKRLLLVGLGILACQGQALGADGLPLFKSSEAITATLEVPLSQLLRSSEDESVEGSFRFEDEGETRTLGVRVSLRGHSRRELCDRPPLKLDFKRSELTGTIFEGQNRLKLATHCQASKRFYGYLQQEYALYRAYASLTDAAFRVRKVDIAYHDSEGRKRDRRYPAFLIESDGEVADRLGYTESDLREVAARDLDPDAVTRLGLFQYLIGNTDWSLRRGRQGASCCHNGLLLENPSGAHVIVPYDFDQAGLIDANYALPAEGLPIDRVRQRLFRGLCTGDGRVEKALRHFNERRAAIEGEFPAEGEFRRINRRARKYIDDFYETVNDPRALQKRVIDDCRGSPADWLTSSRPP
jgi:hypothetical protein